MSQLELLKKQIETVDKVLADKRKQAEAIRLEISNTVAEQLVGFGVNHKHIEYSIDSIRLGATEGRDDISIYMRSDWNNEQNVKIEISWYSSSATVGAEGDQRHFDYLVMMGQIAKALQNPDCTTMLMDTRLEYTNRIKETGIHDLYSVKDKLEREHNDFERTLKKLAAQETFKVGATYIVKKRIHFGRRDSYASYDMEHPVKLVVDKIKNKTVDLTSYQWNTWNKETPEYTHYGTRQHKIADAISWIEDGYMELAS